MYNFKLRFHERDNVNIFDYKDVFINGVFVTSNFLEVQILQQYYAFGQSSTPIHIVEYYNKDKYLIGSEFLASTGGDFVTPSGCKYCKIIVNTNLENDLSKVCVAKVDQFQDYYNERTIRPCYSTLKRTLKNEKEEKYYRENIESDLALIKGDFDFLESLDSDQKVFIDITDSTGKFNDFTGVFYASDCKFNQDDKKVEIAFKANDQYENLLGSLNKKINIIEKAPVINELEYKKRPIVQIYLLGDKVVTSVVGGVHWETEIQTDPIFDHNTLVNTYRFYNTQNIRFIPTSYAPLLSLDVTGEYDSSGNRVLGSYKLVFEEDDTTNEFFTQYKYHIVNIGDSLGVDETWDDYALFSTQFTNWKNTSINTLLFSGKNGQSGSFYFSDYKIYVRYSTDLLNVRGTPTHKVPDNDILHNNSNYKRVVPYNIGDKFNIYEEYEDFPTEYGKVPDDAPNSGQYYKEFNLPPSSGSTNPIPVSSSVWRAVSLWYFPDDAIRYTEFIDGEAILLRDSFSLSSVIQSLLNASNTNLTFKNTVDYSEFLYSNNNPLTGFNYIDFDTGAIIGNNAFVGNLDYLITPKSNMIVGDYDQAAKQSELSLNDVFVMLRSVFNLYYHIEGNKLRIEHVRFYNKGGGYGDDQIGLDITNLKNLRNGKPWDFSQNKYTYSKTQLPERFEFSWMDKVSREFKGFPMIVNSDAVEKGNIKDSNAGVFTSDIDQMIANPFDFLKDGFAIIGAVNDTHNRFSINKTPIYRGDLDAQLNTTDNAFRFTSTQKIESLTNLDFTNGATILIECFLEGFTGSETIISSSNGFNPAADGFRVIATNVSGNKGLAIQAVNSNYAVSTDIPDNEIDNVWVKIAVKITSLGNVTFIVNGVSYALNPSFNNPVGIVNHTRNVVLGNVLNSGNYDRPLNGSIKRATIVQTSLSSLDIASWNSGNYDASGAVYNVDFTKPLSLQRVPFIERNFGSNNTVILQNGFLSYHYLVPEFQTYNLPSKYINVNGDDEIIEGSQSKEKVQNIDFPYTEKIDPYKLINTSLGKGLISDLEIDMLSNMIKATLKHDTY